MPKRTLRTSPHRLRLQLRRNKALQMRLDGAPFQMIADTLGYASKDSAYRSVIYELEKQSLEAAEGIRSIEELRHDAVLKALWPSVVSDPPDLKAVAQYIKLSQRYADMMGLDSPAEKRPRVAPPKPKEILIDISGGEQVKALQQPQSEAQDAALPSK